ncbi:translesion DNA synthesis-associated protein ImuA [Aestuariibacter sp. AA17]|uniref:Translesion DNA synthesis-associated protein ImuA n=1 Tax=Fluctibacter corallii TaxID=2984329 RepID=A0ABT3AC30_9ALTE|nr:translesion DNA synthesis-associated protein ImuA [Aestuariibacter sp. AA17]MCV2886142.1 translesion DNA synthesis-associated protein ImuA [Aestuariibacter sp. AA17]
MNSVIEHLKNKHLVWQASAQTMTSAPPLTGLLSENGNTTGFPELDQHLHEGLPQHGLVDMITPIGIGELRLIFPALQERQTQQGRLFVLIAPPMHIGSEALLEFGFCLSQILIIQPKEPIDALWSAEQCLKSGCCHTVLLWHDNLEIHHVKRLLLAAEQGRSLHILLRSPSASRLSLPVPIALQLHPDEQGIQVDITKRKGGYPTKGIQVHMRHRWSYLTQKTQHNVVPFTRRQAG